MTHYRMDDPHNPPPRDGTNIDLWRNGERFVGKWHRIEKQWIYRCRFNTLNYADDEFFDRWSPIVPPPAEPQEPLPPGVEQDYQDFWKSIVERDGVIDLRQLKLELSDFRTVMRGAAKVYDHVTGGRVSKPNTDPDVVCSLADDRYRKCREEDEPHESSRDLFVAEDGGSNFSTWRVFEQVAPGEYEKAGGPFADSEAANAAMARMLAEKEPQESLIRWHGPEVAATWPDGSAVLVDHSEGPRRYCVDLAWNKIEVNAKHAAKWRYALIKRGGE